MLVTLAGCDALETDQRLAACWVGRHANAATATHELPAIQVARQFELDPLSHPELTADQLVFVVVYDKGAVIPREVNGQVVNFTRPYPICVWFNDRTVYFYERPGPLLEG